MERESTIRASWRGEGVGLGYNGRCLATEGGREGARGRGLPGGANKEWAGLKGNRVCRRDGAAATPAVKSQWVSLPPRPLSRPRPTDVIPRLRAVGFAAPR